MYQTFVKLGESRNTAMAGPLTFATAEDRKAYVMGDTVYWYHYVEEDDWTSWSRGGAWKATARPLPADREVTPPEITEDDRL
jgi:hypothetical protein